jgi:hypothetical protein
MYKYKIITTLFVLSIGSKALASDTTDNRKMGVLIGVQASLDLPHASLAKRFGVFNKIGPTVLYKTKSNWLLGGRAHFTFGNTIKEPGFINNLATTSGGTISNNGILGDLRIYQRGYNIGIDFGKIFAFNNKNPNTGLFWLNSIGFTEHKILLFDRDNQFPQLQGEYKKGYDRLANGIYIDETIGYMYLAKNKRINFFAGLNFNFAPTQGRREWWLDVQTTGKDKRTDISTGILLGWIVPIYKRKVEEIYY